MSLTETRRVDGKVPHEHIAQLGSLALEPMVFDRIEFWRHLHERMARLSNRIDAAALAKLLGDIHARVPMVTTDEQRALQRENAEAYAKFWSHFHGLPEICVPVDAGRRLSFEEHCP